MDFSEKLKLIRREEKFTQITFAEEVDIPLNTLIKYERGSSEPGGKALMKITNHPRFKKYTLWLMTGDVHPESGQVCPAFSTQDTQKTLQNARVKA